MIDLHVHTTYSDGALSPREVVRLAFKSKVKAIAITDHDTTEGNDEALLEGDKLGVEVIPGVEISVEHEKGHMHILGLLLDDAEELRRELRALQDGRESRNPKIIEKLKDFDIHIEYNEVKSIAGNESVGRPHIAQVMIKHGYVDSIDEAFERYLKKGAPCYVDRFRLKKDVAIKSIKRAGGIPVLAHPVTLKGDREELELILEELIKYGLEGIEVYYSTHTDENVREYRELAEVYNLLMTGGTDFHGDNKPDIKLGVGKGNLSIPYEFVEELKKRKVV